MRHLPITLRRSVLVLTAIVLALNGTTAFADLSVGSYTTQNTGEFLDRRAKKLVCSTAKSNATTNGNSIVTGATTGASIPVGSNVQKVFSFLVDKGLTNIQAAAIVGNFMVEAPGPPLVNPTQNENGGGPGRGIAQWGEKGRWQTLLRYAGNDTAKAQTLELQQNFVWKEFHDENYNNSYTKFFSSQTKTIDQYVTDFMLYYEQPKASSNHLDRRIASANTVMLNDWAKNAAPTHPIDPGKTAAPASGSTANNGNPCGGSSSGGNVVDIATTEYNKRVRENPIGCDAGNSSAPGDCGVEVNKYTDSHLEYWCADFVSWVFNQAGTPFTGGASGGWRIAGVGSLTAWFKKNGTYIDNGPSAHPKAGDVFFIGDKHTGIVTSVNDSTGYMEVISGNTSVENYSNGVGVDKDVIQNFRTSTRITGFGALK